MTYIQQWMLKTQHEFKWVVAGSDNTAYWHFLWLQIIVSWMHKDVFH